MIKHNIKIALTDIDTGETLEMPCLGLSLSICRVLDSEGRDLIGWNNFRPLAAAYDIKLDAEGAKRYDPLEA